jgi:hypothetical protein
VIVPAPAWQASTREERYFVTPHISRELYPGDILRGVLVFKTELAEKHKNNKQLYLREHGDTLPQCLGRR